jgi:hypothetical protein
MQHVAQPASEPDGGVRRLRRRLGWLRGRLLGDRPRMIVAGVLAGTMALLLGASADALAGLLGGAELPTATTTPRPEWLPAAMPLPADVAFVFSLPTGAGDSAAYFYVRRPVAEVIADLQERLAAEGWTIVARQVGVTWPDDHLFHVAREGQTWRIHVEPSVASPTETNVIYAHA